MSIDPLDQPDPRRPRRRRAAVEITAPPAAARGGWQPWLAFLPLVCVALGGGTARWSQGVVVMASGGLLVAFPPRTGLGRGVNGVLVGLCALALAAFLPAGWFAWPDWRVALTEDFGLKLPATLSPQPWLSAEAAVLFLAGIGWFYRMATVRWDGEERLRAGRIFAGGTVALAGLFVLFYKQGIRVPFWLTERHFGPFPNRNQTADFLAVGALPVLGCMFVSWRTGRRRAAAGWLVGWLVVATAVFNNFSRAGVGILFIGTAAFVGVEAVRSLRRRPPPVREVKPGDPLPDRAIAIARWRQVSLAVTLILVLASGFFLFGGETLGRFQFGQAAGGTGEIVTDEFRARLQRDALDMIAASPVVGVGLGNFAPVFELFRHRSLAPVWIVHPESDWLWTASELGWPAVGLVLAGCALMARRLWPWRRGIDRPLRVAAALGVGLFALHGLVDVSAHRLGTVFCALFLLGLALPERGENADVSAAAAGWPGGVFRVLGLVLMGVGGLWLVEAFGWLTLPGETGVARLKARTAQLGLAGDYAGAEQAATRALGWAPLDWELYSARASARVYRRRDPQAALDDFRRARCLEPFAGGECYGEARLWAAANESALAANALAEACRREPERAERYIRGVADVAADGEAAFRERFRLALRRDPVLEMAYLRSINLGERGPGVASIVTTNPELRGFSDAQKQAFLAIWAHDGDAPALVAAMDSHPAWQGFAWRAWATACAGAGAEERACGIVAAHIVKPEVPPPHAATRSLADWQSDAARSPRDPVAALGLHRALRAVNDRASALAALHRTTVQPGCPAYFFYLEATQAAEIGQWPAAWEAWRRYLEKTAPDP